MDIVEALNELYAELNSEYMLTEGHFENMLLQSQMRLIQSLKEKLIQTKSEPTRFEEGQIQEN